MEIMTPVSWIFIIFCAPVIKCKIYAAFRIDSGKFSKWDIPLLLNN